MNWLLKEGPPNSGKALYDAPSYMLFLTVPHPDVLSTDPFLLWLQLQIRKLVS